MAEFTSLAAGSLLNLCAPVIVAYC